jgi:hypothetical protein
LFPVGEAVRGFLRSAQIPETQISSFDIRDLNNFKLAEPLTIDNNSSLIQAAANICAQYGHLMYQNNTGQVRIKNITTKSSNYAFIADSEQLLSYSLTSQPEQAIKQLEAEYNDTKILSSLGVASNVVQNGDVYIETKTARNDVTKTIVNTLSEYRILPTGSRTLVAETVTTSVYETTSQVNRIGQLSKVSTCFPGSEARILSRTTVTKSDNTIVLQAWLAYKEAAMQPTGFSVAGIITSSRFVETWSYSDSIIQYTANQYSPIAKTLPVIADRQLVSNNVAIADIQPLSEIIDLKIIEIYSKSTELSSRWRKTRTEYLNKNLIDPTAILARSSVTGAQLSSIIADQYVLQPVKNDIEFNSSLPSFDTYDTNLETVNESNFIYIGSASNPGILESITLGNYYEPNFEYLQSICRTYFNYQNGRQFSCQGAINLPASNVWKNLVPLEVFRIYEESNNTNFAYYLDSPALTFSDTELVFSFTGVSIGTAPLGSYITSEIEFLETAPLSLPVKEFAFAAILVTISERSFVGEAGAIYFDAIFLDLQESPRVVNGSAIIFAANNITISESPAVVTGNVTLFGNINATISESPLIN